MLDLRVLCGHAAPKEVKKEQDRFNSASIQLWEF